MYIYEQASRQIAFFNPMSGFFKKDLLLFYRKPLTFCKRAMKKAPSIASPYWTSFVTYLYTTEMCHGAFIIK